MISQSKKKTTISHGSRERERKGAKGLGREKKGERERNGEYRRGERKRKEERAKGEGERDSDYSACERE
tara:strand:- start:1044 stop:1250 length:207 start_codon:yes stop_codon:yes gene_type:complete